MKTIVKLLTLILILFPLIGETKPNIKYHSFLKNGFNNIDGTHCLNLITACPIEHNFPNEICVKNVLNNHPYCDQLQKLSQILKVSASQLTVLPEGFFSLVNVIYPADGQHRYYIITPRGYLVDTVIDPRSLNKYLQQKYKKADFLISNEDTPYYEKELNGNHQFSAILKINESCLACKIIGRAKVDFNFDPQGKLVSIILVGFDDNIQSQ